MTTEKEMLVSEIIQEYGCCSFEELSDGLEAAEEKGCRNEYLATVFNKCIGRNPPPLQVAG